ncbi:MAG: 2-phospho-L-lactate guanylyltransferase [Betaproteobacteria bacterium]
MSVWLVVPVKSLRDGKSRLAPALNAAERRALIEHLLARTLQQAAQFPGLDRTLLVSACEDARARAKSLGANVLEEHVPFGLNSALRQAQSALREYGATRMLMVSCDLPLLEAEDLRALARASSADAVALAPDRGRQGTNGVCLPTSIAFDFSFGTNSFVRHLDCLRQRNLRSTAVDRPGLAFDVDLPEHLAELRAADLPLANTDLDVPNWSFAGGRAV